MGRGSLREDKSVYQIYREERGLTREAAEEETYINRSRIEKIETGKVIASPDEILMMAEKYKRPELCNYYCTHECAIGVKNVPEVREMALPQIVLELLDAMNALEKRKDRLIEITCDGKIDCNTELKDFADIHRQLSRVSASADSLQLWIEKTVADGGTDKKQFESLIKP